MNGGATRRQFIQQTGLTALAAMGALQGSSALAQTAGAPNEADRHRILVENPETLYGFKKGA
jgi:hypothetical protein